MSVEFEIGREHEGVVFIFFGIGMDVSGFVRMRAVRAYFLWFRNRCD